MENVLKKSNIEKMYKALWTAQPKKNLELLDQSCNPANPQDLYQSAGSPPINEKDKVLDLGSGLGKHTFAIANQFKCHVTGVDMCKGNLSIALQEKEKLDIKDRVEFVEADIHDLPFDPNTFDIIWCRDVLIHPVDLSRVFSECSRVLKTQGKMIIYTTYATKLITDTEIFDICSPLNIVSKNLDRNYFIESFSNNNFIIVKEKELFGEWIEFNEESYGQASQYLMRLTRMRRENEKFKQIFGEEEYNFLISNYLWHIFLLIGKLSACVYQLKLN